MSRHFAAPILLAGLLVTPAAGAQSTGAPAAAPMRSADATPAAKAPVAKARPPVIVHRDAGCGCCEKWADHLRDAGFPVEVRISDDMEAVKARLGVPRDSRSCHTAEVAGYFVEGHVPAATIDRLLAQRPRGRGIAVPGMPIGSPGMEAPGVKPQPYTVEFIDATGKRRTFTEH